MSLSPRLDPTRETSAIAATVSAPAVTASSHPSSDIVTASAPNPHVTSVPYSFSPRRLSSRKRPASAMLGLDKHKSSPQNPPRSSDASPPASIAQLPSSTQLQYQPPSTHSTSAPPQTLRHDTYEYDTQKQLRQQLELMHQAVDVQPPNNPAHQPSYTYSTQLNPPQMQGRNQMQDQSTLPSHFYQPVQSVRSRPDDIPADPANLLIESNAAVAQHLFVDNLDSPGSPGNGFKRQRSSADSDAGSSSCKDMDETEVFAPDSVGAFVDQLRKLIHYVQSKPALHNGSASFMRDYLRTMLIQSSLSAEDVIAAASKHHKTEVMAGRRQPVEYFKMIPEELAKHIFNFLDGTNLARAREVCKKWNEFASEEPLWKTLCLQRWRSLETDKDLWRLINRSIDIESPTRWRKIYPRVSKSPQWRCRLQKTGRFICNLIAHQISGTPLGEAGLPGVLVVERRFNILHLQRFVLPDATVLYLEPEQESDRAGFDDFIEYLNRRTRAGLALEDQRRFIFIPPCEYTRTQVEYHGRSLLGVVQNAYPPLEP